MLRRDAVGGAGGPASPARGEARPPGRRGPSAIVIAALATAVADRWETFALLFVANALSWAGVPAIGAASMGAAGVLASQGSLHLWAVIVVGTLGSELGGLAGWWIGNRVARAGLDEPGRFAKRRNKALSAGEKVAAKWGRLIVFLVPSWVSGALGTPFRQFAWWNVAAAFLWTLAAGLGAYGLGSAFSGGELKDTLVSLLVAAAAIAAIFALGMHHRRHHQRVKPTPEAPPPRDPAPAA
jgi:membrane protein DedA with SNARE-associated domain